MRLKAALVLLALLVAWALWRLVALSTPTAAVAVPAPGPASAPRAMMMGAHDRAPPAPAAHGPRPPSPASAAGRTAGVNAALTGADALVPDAFGVAVWDLCGVGRVPVPPGMAASGVDGSAELPAHLGGDAQVVARQHLWSALESGGLRARAAAAAWQGFWRERSSGNPALQALARGASDPVVLSWALAQCREWKACEGLSPADWARLEPDNAAPWSMLLDKAPPERAEVIQGLARSRRYQLHYGVLAGTVQEAMPSDIPPYLQMNLVSEALAIELAMGMPPLQPLVALCRPAPPQGSAAHAVCDSLARVLADHSDTLLGLRIGLRLGEFAGWPIAEVQRRRAQADVLPTDAMMVMMGLAQPYSCRAVALQQAWMADLARLGELAAFRQWAAAASAAGRR